MKGAHLSVFVIFLVGKISTVKKTSELYCGGLLCHQDVNDARFPMTDFLKSLRLEVQRLQSEMEQTPSGRRWKAARELLLQYNEDDLQEPERASEGEKSAQNGDTATKFSMERIAEAYLKGRYQPVPTLELLDEMKAQGVMVGGAIPRNTLSSVLSRSEKFQSHGRSGWMLANPPTDHNTDETSGAHSSTETPEVSVTTPAEGREAAPGGGP